MASELGGNRLGHAIAVAAPPSPSVASRRCHQSRLQPDAGMRRLAQDSMVVDGMFGAHPPQMPSPAARPPVAWITTSFGFASPISSFDGVFDAGETGGRTNRRRPWIILVSGVNNGRLEHLSYRTDALHVPSSSARKLIKH